MCPASLDVGQVWELTYADELTPGLLLYPYEDQHALDGAYYWRVLDLCSGVVYSATVRRWMEPARGRPLVGRRLL